MASDQTPPYRGHSRRHTLSFSQAVRSSIGKKASFTQPPTPPSPLASPTCAERVHYPIFDPSDPRHNPAVPTEWNQSENRIPQTSTISTTTHRDGVRWMQNLPQRSLRKARSGFLALRSGMQRHGHGPTRARSRGNIPGVWSSSDSGEGSLETEEFPSNVSEASTEEDFGFGTSLYRTLCNCSSALMGDPERYLLRGRSSITLIGLGRLPRLESESENSSSAPRTVDSSEDDDLDHQLARKLSMRNASKNHGHIAREASQRVSDSSGSGSRSGSGSGSSRPSISNIPRIGVNLQLEPLRLFGASREASSISEGSPDVPVEHAEPVGVVDSAYTEEATQEDSNEKDADENSTILSNLSYHPELLDDLVPNLTLLRQEGEDVSIGQSVHSNGHSEGDTTTAPTSISNNVRSSTDEEIISLTSIEPSVRDEYFLMDKTNHPPPDGGANTVKLGTASGGSSQGSESDQRPPRMSQEVEIIGPGGPRRRAARSGGSDSTDEYLATYSMWQRHYFP